MTFRRTIPWLMRRPTPRVRAAVLLVAWFAGLLLPVFHMEEADESLHERGRATASSCGHDCAGHFLPTEKVASVRAGCPDDGKCHDPFHHHHPISHHDATQCPICSSLIERLSETPIVFDAAPTRVERVALAVVRLPPPAERLVVALARGPPCDAAVLEDGASGA